MSFLETPNKVEYFCIVNKFYEYLDSNIAMSNTEKKVAKILSTINFFKHQRH